MRNFGVVGIYLLFLAVQLNLYYTFPDPGQQDLSGQISNPSFHQDNSSINAKTLDGKSVVQKIRLNKRFLPEQAFQLFSIDGKLEIFAFEVKSNSQEYTSNLTSTSILNNFLRGPPILSSHII